MSPNTPKNLYYTVPLDDDLESQDYLQEKQAPWLSVPVRSASAPSRFHLSPWSVLKQKLWPSTDNGHHHNNNNSSSGRENGKKGFWDRYIWLVHAFLLTISMTLFALSMCTLQTAASTTATAVQCQCEGPQGTVAGVAVDGTGASSTSFGKHHRFRLHVTDVDISWMWLVSVLILFCLWILVAPRSFFDEREEEEVVVVVGKETTTPTAPAVVPAVVLPVPIVVERSVPESKHVDMEISVDDKTWAEDRVGEQE